MGYSLLDKIPSNAFTSYSTAIFNNAGITRCFLHGPQPEYRKDTKLYRVVNGSFEKISSKRFVELYKNASVNIDSNFGISLLIPTDDGFILQGCGGLAHELIQFRAKDIELIKRFPKVKNIPPKMYRYGKDLIFIQYPNGVLVKIDNITKWKVTSYTNPYEGANYVYNIVELSEDNVTIYDPNSTNSEDNKNYCITNEHTSITGTIGIVEFGPKCYNELRSYYDNIVNTFCESIEGETYEIENSYISWTLFRRLSNTPGVVNLVSSVGITFKYVILNSDSVKNNIHNLLTFEEVYSAFNKQVTGVEETLSKFITTVNTEQQNLLRFIPINDSLNSNLYGKDTEFDPVVFNQSFPSTTSMSYNLAKNQELNALNAMSEIFNNYLHDKVNTTDNPDKYQWMFYDNAVLLLEQDEKYWYINIIKYSDRYDKAQYRQVIRKDLVKNLIVSYSNNILTLKFSDINSADTKPTMVRIYDLNSDKPHSPVYSDDEVYHWSRSYSTDNSIITDKFDIKDTYYSNGMLFRTESDQSYGNIQYDTSTDKPDIMLFTGEKLNRISFANSGN